LRRFQNKELKRIFGPKGEEGATDGCRKFHNEELDNLHSS
jgi:hypothetical protein